MEYFELPVFFWRCLWSPSNSEFRFDVVFLSFVIVLRIFARNVVVQKSINETYLLFSWAYCKKNMCVLKFAIVIVNVRTKMVRTFLKGLAYAWLVRPCKKVCIFYMHRCIHWQIVSLQHSISHSKSPRLQSFDSFSHQKNFRCFCLKEWEKHNLVIENMLINQILGQESQYRISVCRFCRFREKF